jgi:putative ATP-dependent endonuclease of OLD family
MPFPEYHFAPDLLPRWLHARSRVFPSAARSCVLLDTRSLLVGGNAVGKSTVCEALDLALGLERLYRRPVIDEYDFHQALYRGNESGDADPPPEVRIEVVLTELSAEAQRRFAGHLRPWSAELNDFTPPADIADADAGVTAAGDGDSNSNRGC